jgi:hypothetical protein
VSEEVEIGPAPRVVRVRVAVAGAVAVPIALLLGHQDWSLVALAIVVVIGIALLVTSLHAPRPGWVSIEGDVLSFQHGKETRSVPLGDVTGAMVRFIRREPHVVLDLRGGRQLVVPASERDARAFMEAIHHRPEKSAAEIAVRGPGTRVLVPAVGAIAAITGAWLGFTVTGSPADATFGGTLAMVVGLTLVRLLSPKVLVGVDGVRSADHEFIPFSRIEGVDVATDAPMLGDETTTVSVRLRGGGVTTIASMTRYARGADPVDSALTIEWQIRSAIESASPPGERYASMALLDRGMRSVGEWRSALEALARDGGYRDVQLTSDDLRAILASASHPEDRRIAAAIVLATREPRDPRIMAAARATANPRVRAALEGIAAGKIDDAAIARASRSKEPTG